MDEKLAGCIDTVLENMGVDVIGCVERADPPVGYCDARYCVRKEIAAKATVQYVKRNVDDAYSSMVYGACIFGFIFGAMGALLVQLLLGIYRELRAIYRRERWLSRQPKPENIPYRTACVDDHEESRMFEDCNRE